MFSFPVHMQLKNLKITSMTTTDKISAIVTEWRLTVNLDYRSAARCINSCVVTKMNFKTFIQRCLHTLKILGLLHLSMKHMKQHSKVLVIGKSIYLPKLYMLNKQLNRL